MEAGIGVTHITWEAIPWQGALDVQLSAAWDALVAQDRDTPVFRYRAWFTSACITGSVTPWGVLAVKEDGQCIALFPLQKSSPWTWRFISFGTETEAIFLIAPGREQAAWAALADWLRALPGVAYLDAGILTQPRHIDAFRAAGQTQALRITARPCRMPFISSQLADSWEDYLASLRGEARRYLTREERVLKAAYPDITIDYLHDLPSCLEAIEAFITLFRRRWEQQPGGCFLTPESHAAFYRAVIGWAVQQGLATVCVMRARGRIVSVKTFLHVPGQTAVIAHLVARDTTAFPKQFSPGLVECNHTVRWAISQGYRVMHMGLGNSEYKRKYGATVVQYATFTATRRPLSAVLLPKVDRLLYVLRRLPIHLSFHLRRLESHRRRPTGTIAKK
ncbi:MAG TPA: GNAT family N-acetyltransferase [Armatimonadota bacterium]|jgi:CelD/BcsL family acetyltransferase involved in cellulose biosynthesis